MTRSRPRTREYRMMVRTASLGLLLKIISRKDLALGVHEYFKKGQRRQHQAVVVEDITCSQLERLIRELERQLAGVRQCMRLRIAVRSADIAFKIAGHPDDDDGFQLYVKDSDGFVPINLTAKQLATLIANLKREHNFAARETRTHM